MNTSPLHFSAGRAIGRRRFISSMAAVTALTTLAACGGGDAPAAATAAPNSVSEGVYPDYYPADYSSIVDGSKAEGGELTIYSNTDQENWAPIFRDFQKKYPWVKTINANNLDSDEVFQRALSEQATGSSPADVLVSNAAQAWAEYAEGGTDRLAAYESPELSELPDFATLLPNVYTMSTDPMTIAYNTALLPEGVTGVSSLAQLVAADPAKFADKITTRDVGGAFGFTVSNAFTTANPDAWTSLETILPQARPETSSGTQTEKILSGEYMVGFFISGAPAYPIVANSGGLLQVAFPDDGTVVLPRGIGIAPKAPHMNTAKLFTDFVLSTEGQRSLAEGGLTSYREDVKQADGLHTYQEVVDKVGQDKVILVKYELVSEADVTTFTDKWDGLLGQ
ncbi:ABC transporter substrate-binding protein [Nakamurella deserti]|uniref:ABC transporter substrate-binding protein n=1 Tax=Nakamurella deserti TaxID=2164074 RepID=UPI00197C4EF3|nr:ABC transporter substrate-binding protein [Nakamurella deserti]